MKINFFSRSLQLFMPLFFFMSAFVHAQETHVVTLYVDTEQISTNIPDPELGSVCNFGQEEGVSNEAYSITVNLEDIVQWKGVAMNGSDIVNIEQILYVRGPNPFPDNRRELPGTGEGAKTVTVQVTQSTGEASCKYLLKFTVIRNGEPLNRMFNIDPDIRVR
ncbi:hypothetical protein [Robertkochia flava]|uniref:hypothetical protein n=1 Tax=Robertkochia flava TaxID=3447986 RepID=UPI001CCF7CF0|nr:hypothetical protein [Robertkochia marina]